MQPVCQRMIFLPFILLCHIILLKYNLTIQLSGLLKWKGCHTLPVTKETRSLLLNTKVGINFGRGKICVKK